MKVEVHVKATVNPTEDPEKVREAVENVFQGDLSLILEEDGGGSVRGKGEMEALRKLKELLKREQIRAAARKHLNSLIDGERLIFYLNKQVGYVNHISFCKPEGESPLGPIRFEVYANNLKNIVEWLTKTN